MNNIEQIDERVDVVVIHRSNGDVSSWCFPWKMRYQNREIIFKELGLRHPTTKGKRYIHVFDMNDGMNDYRLEYDAQSLVWKLAAITEGYSEN